jgi:hypothetical protein
MYLLADQWMMSALETCWIDYIKKTGDASFFAQLLLIPY